VSSATPEPFEADITRTIAEIRENNIELRIHHNKLFFSDPKCKLSRDKVEWLKAHEDEVLIWLAKHAFSPGRDVTDRADCFVQIAPLAFQQQSAIVYREPNFYGIFSARLHGELDVDVLSRSLAIVVQRHSALKSRVVMCDGALVQEIPQASEDILSVETLFSSEADVTDDQAHKAAESFVAEWLSDGRDAFLVHLIRVASGDHVLVVAWDHLFEDYFCALLVFREIWTVYRDLSRHNEISLQSKPVQYYEYAVWQRRTYSKWCEENGSYWKQRLAVGKSLELRSDSTCSDAKPLKDRAFKIQLEASLSQAVCDLAQSQQILPALAIFAVCSCLLSSWSGQREFLFPFYVLGRHSSRHFRVVGYLSHPVPLTIKLQGSDRFVDMLRRISNEFLDASERLSNGMTLFEAPNPFETPFLQWFDSSPDLFNAVVSPSADSDFRETGLSAAPFPISLPFSESGVLDRVPLFVSLWNSPQGIVGGGLYRSDLFRHSTVLAFANGLRSACEAVVRDPAICIQELRFKA